MGVLATKDNTGYPFRNLLDWILALKSWSKNDPIIPCGRSRMMYGYWGDWSLAVVGTHHRIATGAESMGSLFLQSKSSGSAC